MAPIASTSRIRRIVLIAGIFTMILGLGVAWLWRTAAGSGEQPDGPAQDSSWVDSGGAGSGADTAPGTTDDDPGVIDDDGGPPVPRTAIEVAGPTLDNTNPDNTCSALISKNVDVPMRITKVGISSGPLVRLESGHCRGIPRADQECSAGVTLRHGDSGCYVGIALVRKPRQEDDLTAVITVSLQARCTARDQRPCGGLGDEFEPTPRRPVDVQWTTRAVGLSIGPLGPEEFEPDDDTGEPLPTTDESPETGEGPETEEGSPSEAPE